MPDSSEAFWILILIPFAFLAALFAALAFRHWDDLKEEWKERRESRLREATRGTSTEEGIQPRASITHPQPARLPTIEEE